MSLVTQLRRSDRPGEISAVLTTVLKEPVKEAVVEALEENPELWARDVQGAVETEADEADDSGSRFGRTSTLLGGYVVVGLAVVSALALWSRQSSDDAPFGDSSRRVGDTATSTDTEDVGGTPFTSPAPERDETDAATGEDASRTGTTESDAGGYGDSPEESDYESTDDEIGTHSSSSS